MKIVETKEFTVTHSNILCGSINIMYGGKNISQLRDQNKIFIAYVPVDINSIET